jgi:5-oxoprolinase (ATP-hydrolysing) subunit A
MALLLNADLGEIEDPDYKTEKALMPLIDLANVACGCHAGNPATIANTLALAAKYDVKIGAHPGYHDRENFGRLSIPHSPEELAYLIHYQISAIEGMATIHGLEVDYIKPHGALYNDMMENPNVRQAVFVALGQRPPPRKAMLLATRHGGQYQQEANRFGIELIFEAFADRRYDHRGFLVSRREPGAVLNHQQMLEQVQQLVTSGTVKLADGTVIDIPATTLCVHGDTPDSIAAIREIRAIVAE